MSAPEFGDRQLTLPEHKYDELLATATYLVLCYRENETFPFGFEIMRGAAVVANELPSYYHYFLLPQRQSENIKK
jgi:hypothetical protein